MAKVVRTYRGFYCRRQLVPLGDSDCATLEISIEELDESLSKMLSGYVDGGGLADGGSAASDAADSAADS